jgi:integrase
MLRFPAMTRETRWEGGRIKYGRDGRPVFIIQKQVAGTRYYVSTHAHTRRAALEHLARFEADPEGYDPRGVTPDPIFLDETLAREFLRWSKDERKNSREWRQKQKRALDWWAERLKGVDLRSGSSARSISLADHVRPALKDAPARHHKTAVLKGLYTYLRTVAHRISTAEDPVYGQLSVPQARPAQWTKTKVIPRDHFDLVREHLVGVWRDGLTIQGGTGWHTTELCRFAEGGVIEPVPRATRDEDSAGVLVCPQRKSGEPQRTRVSTEVLEAAKRLLAHGPISRQWYDRAVKAACKVVKRPDGESGIPKFTPGRLRHSVATWAIDAGADPASVSAYLGHKSPRTTRKFYATHAAPKKVPTLV